MSSGRSKNAKLGGATSHPLPELPLGKRQRREARTRGRGPEWLAPALLPPPNRACPSSTAIWETIVSSPTLLRELKKAGPEKDTSKVGRTFRKRKASASASCRRQVPSLWFLWSGGPQFSESELCSKPTESPWQHKERGEESALNRALGSEWQADFQGGRKSPLHSANRHRLSPGGDSLQSGN